MSLLGSKCLRCAYWLRYDLIMKNKSVYDILFTPDEPDEPDEPAATTTPTPVGGSPQPPHNLLLGLAPTIIDLLTQILAELKTLTALLKK